MPRLFLITVAISATMTTVLCGDEASLRQAEALLLRGRYAEALDAARSLESDHPVEAVLLRADALASTGKATEARTLLLPLFEREKQSRKIARAMALLCDRRWPNGDGIIGIDRLLALDPNDLVGRWFQAKRLIHQVKYEEGQQALDWFAENHEKLRPASADDALALARSLAEHARWSREASWYNTAVNDVLGQAEKTFPLDWRIPALRAELFAEKHNEPAAVDSLNAALAKNGAAAELHALRARLAVDRFDLVSARRSLEQARRVNPELPEAYLIEADIAFAELRPADAEALLATARSEGEIHREHEVLGRLSAARDAQRRPSQRPSDARRSSARELIVKGDALDRMRRFSQARDAYAAALQVRADYPGLRGRLAQQLLRLGEE
jgi:tetratricopeptide (TPR) repeat protein